MSETEGSEPTSSTGGAEGLSPTQELDLRRYEARLSVWKIVLGTGVVGLAGVLIPGAISLYSAVGDWQRQTAEARLAKETAHQQYIKEFFDTAINQDIELRIRFAQYFAHLSDAEQQQLWDEYHSNLVTQRDTVRKLIGELEHQLVEMKKIDAASFDAASYYEVSRQLQWAYAEVGYVPIDRSVVRPPASNKERLYNETVFVVRALASQPRDISTASLEYVRFWELYNRDLIGVESAAFESLMVKIGLVLRQLAGPPPSPPSDELRALVEQLARQAGDELLRDTQQAQQQAVAPIPSQQQLQLQQQQIQQQ